MVLRSRRLNGGFPDKKHFGPHQCNLNDKGNRCVSSGEKHDSVNCRLNENNNCALVIGHKVHHLEHPRKSRSKRTYKKRSPSSSPRKSNPWLVHVAKYRLQHSDSSYQEALREASKSYVKTEDRTKINFIKGGSELIKVFYTNTCGMKKYIEMSSLGFTNELKGKIEEKEHIPPDQQMLVNEKRVMLEDHQPISFYNITNNSHIYMVIGDQDQDD